MSQGCGSQAYVCFEGPKVFMIYICHSHVLLKIKLRVKEDLRRTLNIQSLKKNLKDSSIQVLLSLLKTVSSMENFNCINIGRAAATETWGQSRACSFGGLGSHSGPPRCWVLQSSEGGGQGCAPMSSPFEKQWKHEVCLSTSH